MVQRHKITRLHQGTCVPEMKQVRYVFWSGFVVSAARSAAEWDGITCTRLRLQLPNKQFASCRACNPHQAQPEQTEGSGFRHCRQVSGAGGKVHNSLGELRGRGTEELGRGATHRSPV